MTVLPLAHAGEFHPVQLLALAGVVLVPLVAIVLVVVFGGDREN